MKIISFESSEERIGFLLLVVFMACVIGFAVWHVYAYPPCAGLYGKELTDCEDYQVYLSEFSDDTGLSVAERVLDQIPADGAEENNLYCNPAPNGDNRHADLRPDLDHEPAGFTRSSIRFPHQRRGVQPSKPAEP